MRIFVWTFTGVFVVLEVEEIVVVSSVEVPYPIVVVINSKKQEVEVQRQE
jgi:hypothetical protein